MINKLFHIHALAPLHVGSGQAIGNIDLPIVRERSTHLPLLPGSGLKGVLRDAYTREDKDLLFGPEAASTDPNAFAGALSVGDARLLILPVRSLVGVVAFVTCPFILKKYRNDLVRTGQNPANLIAVTDPSPETAIVTSDTILTVREQLATKMFLEDLDIAVDASDIAVDASDFVDGQTNEKKLKSSSADEWAKLIGNAVFGKITANVDEFKRRFCIVPDDVFSFLADTAMEIRARIRIGANGVVVKGALWYEENLPAETILWGLLGVTDARKKDSTLTAATLIKNLAGSLSANPEIQLGGKATVGRGIANIKINDYQVET